MAGGSGVVVVGGGVAGLSAALGALDAGASRVMLLEREQRLGGNSAKASFGINALGEGDSVDAFVEDILTAAKAPEGEGDHLSGPAPEADPALARTLAAASGEALAWLKGLGARLEEAVKGAGSRVPRLRRAMGFQLVMALGKKLEEHARQGRATICKGARATELIVRAGGVVCGVRYERDGELCEAQGAVVLCSGGFGANMALMPEARAGLPTTQGPWTLGEGAYLASSAGAAIVGMPAAQVHPTAFVDPKNPSAKSVILASESLRQAGALLINGDGHRFCDERCDIASAIVAKLGAFSPEGSFATRQPLPIRLVVPPAAVESDGVHLGFYTCRGLLVRHERVSDLAQALGLEASTLEAALGVGAQEGPVLCGEVIPAVHYSLGGVKIDTEARVLTTTVDGGGGPVPGLYAAGEAAGGIHGRNRLAGNGLLESVVFGRIAGRGAAEAGI